MYDFVKNLNSLSAYKNNKTTNEINSIIFLSLITNNYKHIIRHKPKTNLTKISNFKCLQLKIQLLRMS